MAKANPERYDPVRDLFPEELPAVTQFEANAAWKLLRQWMLKHYTDDLRGRLPPPEFVRRAWAQSKPRRKSDPRWLASGWPRFAHDASHYLFRAIYPKKRGHDPLHVRYECTVAKFVVDAGWLSGNLKPPAPPKRRAKPKPGTVDKLEAVRRRIVAWEAKQRRASNALAKLRRSEAALLRVLRNRSVDEDAVAA